MKSPVGATHDIVEQLQKEVNSLQGFRKALNSRNLYTGIAPIENAFPNSTFPTGVVHEFISNAPAAAAVTNGFIAGLLGKLMEKQGVCLWVSMTRKIFPPALKLFGIEPERIIFIDLSRPKDVLWTIEEALKCEALAAVVGELKELDFKESRRLQLAVEQSRVTGFIHRHNPKTENTVACVTRWKIKPIASETEEDMPGVGYPRWNVQLLKVRNGKPGTWQVEWSSGSFRMITPEVAFSISGIKNIKTR